MLLPLPAVRAALRLDTPAKRFAWASEQLYGALFPAPAILANPSLNIPAKPANRGVLTFAAVDAFADQILTVARVKSVPNFSALFHLPFNLGQYYRGVPLIGCVGELTTDVYQPYVGTIAAGEPILDNSSAKTFEQYLVEQLSLMIAQSNGTADLDQSGLELELRSLWATSYYTVRKESVLTLTSTLFRTGMIGTNRYGDITGIATI